MRTIELAHGVDRGQGAAAGPLAMELPAAIDVVSATQHPPARAAWRFEWLTPVRCRVILAVLLAYGFVSHLMYLRNDCPIDLSGDEAQYWDWSRQLELSYYSKGPLVAYIIRAACAVFGDVMWAVRLPALILGVGTSILTYLLTLKLFRSDRLAAGGGVAVPHRADVHRRQRVDDDRPAVLLLLGGWRRTWRRTRSLTTGVGSGR